MDQKDRSLDPDLAAAQVLLRFFRDQGPVTSDVTTGSESTPGDGAGRAGGSTGSAPHRRHHHLPGQPPPPPQAGMTLAGDAALHSLRMPPLTPPPPPTAATKAWLAQCAQDPAMMQSAVLAAVKLHVSRHGLGPALGNYLQFCVCLLLPVVALLRLHRDWLFPCCHFGSAGCLPQHKRCSRSSPLTRRMCVCVFVGSQPAATPASQRASGRCGGRARSNPSTRLHSVRARGLVWACMKCRCASALVRMPPWCVMVCVSMRVAFLPHPPSLCVAFL